MQKTQPNGRMDVNHDHVMALTSCSVQSAAAIEHSCDRTQPRGAPALQFAQGRQDHLGPVPGVSLPGMIAVIQTHGELLHWHPHIHVLITCGAFTPEGEFLELPEFDMERLLVAWQDAVFELYLAQEKIEPEVVENMRTWPHSGFSVDQSVYLPAGDAAGVERLIQYMTRCPFQVQQGSGTNCAQHPLGRSGNWYLTPGTWPD